jgi:hypothetical protein
MISYMTFCGVILRNFEELLSIFLTTLAVSSNQGLHRSFLQQMDLSHTFTHFEKIEREREREREKITLLKCW